VDGDGEPLIVFHGTSAEFNTFEKGELGFHFGTLEQAEERGEIIMPVYLSLQNPYDICSDLGEWDDMEMLYEYLGNPGNEGILEEEWEQGKIKTPEDVIAALKRLGYDGIVYENNFEGGGKSWIVFDACQIKSAVRNRGTFAPNSGNIYE